MTYEDFFTMRDMTYDEFMSLVSLMRKTQKDYFKTRQPSALEKSKELERAVDRAVKVYYLSKDQKELI